MQKGEIVMGEEKSNATAVAMRNLGKFNVEVHVCYMDNEKEVYRARIWQDTPTSLALTTDDSLVVIPHNSIKWFKVRPQSDT